MKASIILIGIALWFAILPQGIMAQTDSIWGVGNKAPELKIAKWLNRDGSALLQKGKVYLIDFWATWCVPCIAGMQHLSKLQEKYKGQGLEVIGVTNNDTYGNSLEKAAEFVVARKDVMKYSAAWLPESTNGKLTGIFVHPWLQKTGSMNLPTAFLVDRQGVIIYIGDPHTVDETLDAVMNGKYDIAALRANYLSGLAAENISKQFQVALKENDQVKVIELARQVLNDYPFVKVNTLLSLASTIGTEARTKTIDRVLLELGLNAAQRGVVATKFESPGFLSTLASIYAGKKDYVSAVITQTLAVSVSEGKMKENQLKELEQYKSALK